jgi:hypothetical protein
VVSAVYFACKTDIHLISAPEGKRTCIKLSVLSHRVPEKSIQGVPKNPKIIEITIVKI